MGKKLYEVTIEYTLYVLAESEHDAEREARSNMREEEPRTQYARSVRAGWPVDLGYRDSYPWGGDCDKTVGELLDEMKPGDTGKEAP